MENGDPAPQTCFRVKSWCNRWLSVDFGHCAARATFVEEKEASCGILLLPRTDGRYMLQLLPDSPCLQSISSRLQCSGDLVLNGPPASHDLTKQKIHSWSRNRIVATDRDGRWFLGRRGLLVVASRSLSDFHNPDFFFTLEFDENGCVKFRGGHDNGYLTSDCSGRIWSGTLKARKWEIFQLHEEALGKKSPRPLWNSYAPVRVNLMAYTGKYLCAAKTVICALAEAPCCCEEFLLDMSFPPLPPVGWRSSLQPTVEFSALTKSASQSLEAWNYLPSESFETQKQFSVDNVDKMVHPLKYMIRTADGRCNLTAEADGMLSATRVDEVQGREFFNLELSSQKDHPKVSIRQCSHSNNTKHSSGYLSADPSGKLLFSKSHRHKREEFGFELANSSRVLIRSVHGGFLGCKINSERTDASTGHISVSSRQSRDARMEDGGRKQCACFLWNKQDTECAGAWRLRAHGDSLYTLVAVPTPGGGADVYLFVDAGGRVLQSSEPGVHFPATSSLFEIKATTAACLMGPKTCTAGGVDASIVGFTIRTVRKVNGKQRFLTVEPNGSLKASRLSASRWEMFQFVDVDAAASASFPLEFPCLPAAVNLNALAVYDSVSYGTSGGQLASLSMMGRQTRVHDAFGQPSALAARSNNDNASAPQGASGANTLTVSLKLAAGVAADAVRQGHAFPRRIPSTLQELCIRHICMQASKGAGVSKTSQSKQKEVVRDGRAGQSTASVTSEFANLEPVLVFLAQVGNLVPANIPPNETIEDHFNLPDDLLSRIKTRWRAKKHPQHSCKWLPSAYMPQSANSSQFLWNGAHPHFNFSQQAALGNNGEGWHCSSCHHGGVLSMDPSVNPAHHRYLEVQYHAHSGVTQPTGLLWNIISFAGVSIMSTALFFQFFANAGRRSSRVSR